MNTRWNKYVLALGVLVSVASVIGSVAYSGTFKQASTNQTNKEKQKFHQPTVVTQAPPVVSKVKDLQITEARLVNQGTPEASLAIDVTNNRDSAVMSLDFISGRQEYSGLSIDGLLEEDNPRILIPPHTLKTFTWSLGEIMKGEVVFLAAATFADGKEEGDKRSLEGIRKARANYQLKKKQAKANGGQQ